MKFIIPEKTTQVCEILKNAGYRAYLVGGCVRDMLMENQPQDYDIATDALPEEIEKTFRDAGAYILNIAGAHEHGVVFVFYQREKFEIATFRADKEYADLRHCETQFGVSLHEDLARRDFTVNAMAYDPFTEELVDVYEGQKDLQQKIIRAVGDPQRRFNEDGLRILRAFRFSAQLGFQIEENTLQAAAECCENLKQISHERKEAEITKILLYQPDILIQMHELGILKILLPELDICFACEQINPYHYEDVGRHTIKVIENIEPTKSLRWIALLHDLGKPAMKTTDEKGIDHFRGHPAESARIAEEILKRYKFSRSFTEYAIVQVFHHDRPLPTKKAIRKFIGKFGLDALYDHLKVRRADILAHSENFVPGLLVELEKEKILIEELLLEDPDNDYRFEDLAIKGQDIMDLGVPQGKEIGILLKEAYEFTLEDPSKNNREDLLEYIKETMSVEME